MSNENTGSSDKLLPLISHPNDPRGESTDLLLRKHLTDVGTRAIEVASNLGSTSRRALQIAANLHDFGKITPAFQRHVRQEYTHRGPSWERHHARIGAFATFYALGELGIDNPDRIAATLAVARHHGSIPDVISYLKEDVLEYETSNEHVVQQIQSIDETWPTAADELLSTVTDGVISWAGFRDTVLDGELTRQLEEAISATDEQFGVTAISTAAIPEETYDRFYRFWSALTFADKTHAAGITRYQPQPFEKPLHQLTTKIKSLQAATGDESLTAELTEARERARQQAHQMLATIDSVPAPRSESSVQPTSGEQLTLTLPTGLGKTFTGLSVALDIQDRLHNCVESNQNGTSPVIYALPFTSIIEQTRSQLEDPTLWGADPTGRKFTVHHYLSETRTDVDTTSNGEVDDSAASDDSSRNYHPAQLLGEAWQSGVVLTTFVQLFESITRPSSKTAMKGAAFENAIIILDEPQALPPRWWPAVRRCCKLLREEFGATIISMTATQPALFDIDDSDSIELTPGSAELYDRFERVTYDIDQSVWNYRNNDGTTTAPVSYSSAASDVVASLAGSNPSTLAVCNTVRSAHQLYDAVTTAIESPVKLGEYIEAALSELGPDARLSLEQGGTDIATDEQSPTAPSYEELAATVRDRLPPEKPIVSCLTGEHRPYDRQVLIELMHELTTDSQPFVLVSTQAIEAGVDVSFQTVFRDLAPIPSIVQAAGRCNRSFEWGRAGGDVSVWRLAPPENSHQDPATSVYERGRLPDHLTTVVEVLREVTDSKTAIPERVIANDAVEKYYDRLHEESPGEKRLATYINECRGAALSNERLIQETNTRDVICPVTTAEQSVLDRVQEAFATGDEATGYRLLSTLENCRVSIRPRTESFQNAMEPLDEPPSNEGTATVYRLDDSSTKWYSPEIGISWD
ncbi:CRISPR-associated endonuclease Cas3'' [Halovenus salina]|uniref:CRISPR-associated endonuclease Cas3 n=1 Tax=Halovenus salina TaxID=1510225 RepID=A0ABD5W0Y5_9EURY|nr:CRISPR-associated endonuclease Cas3'' [Halovenus salina]